MTAADVLAVRILLGQLIVRIAAGAQNPAAVLKVMRDSSVLTASGAKLRGLDDEQQDEVRKYVQNSIDRFYNSMQINKGPQPAGAGAAPAAAGAPAAARPAQAAPAKPPAAAAPKAPQPGKPAAAPKAAPRPPEPKKK